MFRTRGSVMGMMIVVMQVMSLTVVSHCFDENTIVICDKFIIKKTAACETLTNLLMLKMNGF